MSIPRLLAAASLCSMLLFAPLSARADGAGTPAADIIIEWDGEFNRAHGVRSGRGTTADPFVISGWTVGNISIRDTTKAVRIEDNTITGRLTLNWIGDRVTVMHNEVGDLRVNENIARWGDPTGGRIMHNTFSTVGQLRHFDGMFMHNTVGAPPSGFSTQTYPSERAVNFDGFNGAHFAENTIYGYVDARLHGHHHGSSYTDSSHTHADGPHGEQIDHTRRYHGVLIEKNKIYSSAEYALAYLDTGHAANDRTANSETNPYLNAPHVHFTRVTVAANRLYGAGLRVDVFNAQDERHKGRPHGVLKLMDNRVTLARELIDPAKVTQGIEVRRAQHLSLWISRNTITGPEPVADIDGLNAVLSQGAGVLINRLDNAKVFITSTRITNRQFGVRALQLSRSVTWRVTGLRTSDVDEPVVYDTTVANPPERD